MSPHILDDLAWRGLIAQSTDLGALRAAMDAGPVTFYCGFDPSAASLQIGNLLQILTMRRLQRAGHRPLALVGGSTGLIGDPRLTAERELAGADVVAGRVSRNRGQIEPFLDFSGPQAARMVNNLDWTAGLGLLDFLRDVGKQVGVNRMLAREAVSARLASESGLSYAEFSYQLLQALDFRELHRRYGCVLQVGGSDQWGNLTAGLDLLRRSDGVIAHALATPLVTKADGTKFGKSEGGAIWLDPAMTSPYAFAQFWLQREDSMVGSYLRLYSDRERAEIEALEAATLERPAAREAHQALAQDLTTLVHGAGEWTRADTAAAALFGRGELADLDPATLAAALEEAGTLQLAAGESPPLVELLERSGLVASRSAGRRAIEEGGAYVNNVRVLDVAAHAAPEDWLQGRFLVLRRGRKEVRGVARSI